ncbi:MAG: hypothetical protein HFJ58_04875 [Clostridia bacterium]|nr:hypothetical protein [Clostridia bacterium]
MGWNPNEGYYQRHVESEGYSNKITEEQKQFNKLSIEEIREGIEIAQQQYTRDMKNIGKVHLKTPYSKAKKEPIEYVVKESKGEDTDFKETVKVSKEDIIDFNTKRKEKEIINFEEKRQNEEENYRGA